MYGPLPDIGELGDAGVAQSTICGYDPKDPVGVARWLESRVGTVRSRTRTGLTRELTPSTSAGLGTSWQNASLSLLRHRCAVVRAA